MASAKDVGETCQVFLDLLKCHMCECGPEAGKYRWYTCLGGHKICQECRSKSSKSRNVMRENTHMRHTLCSCDFPIGQENCKIIETLLQTKNMRFQCSNAKRGCEEILTEEALGAHDCDYRLVKCPRVTCNSDVTYNELLEHMIDNECIIEDFALNDVHSMTMVNNNSLAPMKFVFDDRVFVFTGRKRYSCSYTIHFWIQLIGPKSEAKNYYYSVEFHGNGLRFRNTYYGPVFSIDHDYNKIIDSNECHGITADIFKQQFKDSDERYKVSITIQNMKEEVKEENIESGISDDE